METRVTVEQKRQLAESLTTIVSETLGPSKEDVTVVFKRSLAKDVSRGGKLGR